MIFDSLMFGVVGGTLGAAAATISPVTVPIWMAFKYKKYKKKLIE